MGANTLKIPDQSMTTCVVFVYIQMVSFSYGERPQERRLKMKITKSAQREVLKDIRKQLVWIEKAIKNGDQDWIDQYADQLSATALNLNSEVMKAY